MTKPLTIPGTAKAGDQRTFGGAYPIDDHGTGLNNSEWNGYPATVNDRIYPVAHPLDGSRPACVLYEVRPGDRQPHYGASGERAELWPEPHDGVNGMTDVICASWIVPQGYTKQPSGWCFILQNHPGENSPSLSPWFGVSLLNGEVAVEAHHNRKVLGPVTANREFFVAVRTKLSDNGSWEVWMSWDKPCDLNSAPWKINEPTLQGSPMYWKTGVYRNTGESFTNRVVQTTFARRDSLDAAMKAAGWDRIGSTTPPPPVDPPPVPPTPSPASAQTAIDLIKAANPKIADAIQKTLDYAKATSA